MTRMTVRLAQLALVAAVLAVLGCPTIGGPVLTLSAVSFSFEGTNQRSLFVMNTGSGALEWSVDENELPAWLTVSPTSGTVSDADQTVILAVDYTELTAGITRTSFVVQSNGGNQTVNVSVEYTVPPTPPELELDPELIDLGTSETSGTFFVRNVGGSVLEWAVDDAGLPAWIIDISPTAGQVLGGAEAEVMVSVTRPPNFGIQTADIPILVSGVEEGVVTVQIEVQALVVMPTELDFGLTATSATFSVKNVGMALLDWAIDEDSLPEWVAEVTPNSGSLVSGAQRVVNIIVDRPTDPAGILTGEVRVVAGDMEDSVALSLEVPSLRVSPLTVDFGATTSLATLTLDNQGASSIDFDIAVVNGDTWLSVDPAAGAIDPLSQALVDVSVDRAGLPAGAYTASLNVTSDSGNAIVSVTMDVPLGDPALEVNPDRLAFGDAKEEDLLAILNAGSGTINWQIDTAGFPEWLRLEGAAGGLLSGAITFEEPELVTVIVDRSGLLGVEEGDYAHVITVTGTAAGAAVDPAQATVTMTVSPVPSIFVSHDEVTIPEGEDSVSFRIRNVGTGVLTWSLNTEEFPVWLESVSPAQGNLVHNEWVELIVQANPDLAADSDIFDLVITSNDPSDPEVTVEIELQVPDVESIVVQPENFAILRDSNLGYFEIANNGDLNTVLHYVIEVDEKDRRWLYVSPVRGTSERPVPAPLDWQGAIVSINRSEIDPELGTGAAIGRLRVYAEENGEEKEDIEPQFVEIDVKAAPLTFQVANPRMRIPTRVRYVLLGRNIKYRSLPLALGLDDMDMDGDNAVSYADELALFLPQVMPDEFDAVDVYDGAQGDGFVSIPGPARDPFPNLALSQFVDKFEIIENEQPLELTEAEVTLTDGTNRTSYASNMRTNLIIALDYSGSMYDAAVRAQQYHQELVDRGLAEPDPDFVDAEDPLQYIYEKCIGQLIDELPESYRVAVMEFHDRIELTSEGGTVLHRDRFIRYFTRNNDAGKAALKAAVESIQVRDHGASEILLAALDASDRLIDEDWLRFRNPFDGEPNGDDADVKAVIFVSDGRITTPPGDIDITILGLQNNKTRIFSVGWGFDINHDPMARLALGTGGHYYATFESSYEVGGDDETPPTTVLVPNIDSLYDWCHTATGPEDEKIGKQDLPEPWYCDQSIAKDLKTQFILDYTTLNEEVGVEVRVDAEFDDPNDNVPTSCLREQGPIDTSYSHLVDLVAIKNENWLGQISMRAEKFLEGEPTVYVRAEYVPRSISEFLIGIDSPVGLDVFAVPPTDGGLVDDGWSVTINDVSGGARTQWEISLMLPAGEVLPYAAFGDLLRLELDGPSSNPLQLYVEDAIYIDPGVPPDESKTFVYPDSIVIDSAYYEINRLRWPTDKGGRDDFLAPALPTPSLRDTLDDLNQRELLHGFLGITSIAMGSDATRTIQIRNVGGNWPYPGASDEFAHVALFWLVPTSRDLGVDEVSGVLNTTMDFDEVVIEPDRTLKSGGNFAFLNFEYATGLLGVEQSTFIRVDWDIAPPELSVSPDELDFGTTEDSLSFEVRNDGESKFEFAIDTDVATWPEWLSVQPSDGDVTAEDPETVAVGVDRDLLTAPGAYTYDIVVNAYDFYSKEPIGSAIVAVSLEVAAPKR